jgi:SAM-dependent methyltransferase
MTYPFADRVAEDERLIAQGCLFDPMTRRVLLAAGLAPGMRVLDIGSGAGNVTRLAAELVGPGGFVTGAEADPAAVELARRHTGQANVEYRVADALTLDGTGDGYDFIIGRLVLMYLPDPVRALRAAAARLRPGGTICMHEGDFEYPWGWPEPALLSQTRTRFLTALGKAGIRTRMGPELFGAFAAAGLPGPQLLMETVAGGGPDAPVWGWGNVVSAAVPLMEKLGVATSAEVGPDTLTSRLLAELLGNDSCLIGPPMTGAWAVVPAGPGE